MIGCGGSGVKTVALAREAVQRHLDRQGWKGAFPLAWQFIGIDTQFPHHGLAPLPNDDYVCISLQFGRYQELSQAIDTKFGIDINPKAFRDLQGWRPNPSQVTVPLRDGAGQLRAIGRLAGILALQGVVRDRLHLAFTRCAAGGPELFQVSRHLGISVPLGTPVPDPITIVVGSMAGGTGAGIMLDVVDLLRCVDTRGKFPVLVAFTPDIFGAVSTHPMTANSAAFMSEMLSAYWDNENTDSALIPATVSVNSRGPYSVFLIGRKNIDGLDLGNSKNVYRATSQTLANLVVQSQLQQSIFHYLITDWSPRASGNSGGYGFRSASLPGVVSSFGTATISIGRDHFRNYLTKLLHRSIIEHLVGDTAQPATELHDVASRHLDRFLADCGLDDSTLKLVFGRFDSPLTTTKVREDIAPVIHASMASGQSRPTEILAHLLSYRDDLLRESQDSQAGQGLQAEIQNWCHEVLRQILQNCSRRCGELSLKVTLNLLRMTQSKLLVYCAEVRSQIDRSLAAALESLDEVRALSESTKRLPARSAAKNLETAISTFVEAVSRESMAQRHLQVVMAFEDFSRDWLPKVEARLYQALDQLTVLTKSSSSQPSTVADWPRNDGVVPNSFAPSPVEFLLEGPECWPQLADQLVRKSLQSNEVSNNDPIAAAACEILRGGYQESQSPENTIASFIHESHDHSLTRQRDGHLTINVDDDIDSMTRRIDAWLMRPSREMFHVLTEGLGLYLMPADYRTGATIPEHEQRLTNFRQNLQMALVQSQPLIEIDRSVNAEVHSQSLQSAPSIQGFPFGQGHPARAVTEQLIQGFLNEASNVGWAFSSGDAESVSITSFLRYPVNPSVVKSFTVPLHRALAEFTPEPERLRSSFWLWRRSRTLDKFIPLPHEMRIAAIRGCAVARILGVVTADPVGQNRISTSEGVFNFPRHLLTETDKGNFLPALLEAMVLAFADVPSNGKAAFNAYGALIDYGTGGGMTSGFEVDGVFAEILRTGEYGKLQILDQQRADALRNDPQGRSRHGIAYLDANLERFNLLNSRPIHPRSWRNLVGSVDPVDTLTRELLPDLRVGFLTVREALERFIERGTTPPEVF